MCLFKKILWQVYTFGPTFRAENSNTTRHLAEFWVYMPFLTASWAPDGSSKYLLHLIIVVWAMTTELTLWWSKFENISSHLCNTLVIITCVYLQMIEPELAFADLKDDMACATAYLQYVVCQSFPSLFVWWFQIKLVPNELKTSVQFYISTAYPR